MPAISPAALVARLRAAVDPTDDRELLRAFLASRSEPAFAALVHRHGPMVLGVCRRVLGNPHDADDAFQATFLVLARKANAVGQPDRLPGWLHTIAVRTATEIRRMRDRRRKCEVANPERLASECLASRERQRPQGSPVADAPGSPELFELTALLDEELSRLPEHYRVPVVLCELQGRSRKEVAARLNVPEGTLSSRLAKARKLLADRLTRRGLTVTAAAISAALTREATATVPAALAVEAARAALIPAASAAAVHAADGVVKALLVSKLKGVTLAVGMAVLCVGGAATLPGGLGASNVASAPEESKPEALVQQLGSDSPTDRDAAEKQLRAMGPRALPAVIAGAASSDAEFARRCRSIAAALRADIRTAFREEFHTNGTGTYTHPVWKRYRAIAGDSAASRTLFAAIISDPQRFQRLDDAESDPMAAINAYKTEIARLAASNRAKQDPDATQLPDIAECLLLGSQTITAKAVPHRPPGASVCAERFALLGPRLWKPDALNGPSREPVARLYAAWCDRRALPDVLQFGLDRAINWRISETLPTARRVAQTKDATLPLRASALTLLAHFGTEATDAPAAEVLMDNETVIHTVTYQGVGYVTQMRDVATAVRVKLAGRNPKEFGFQTVTGTAFDWSQTPIPAANAFPRGFPTEAARTAAHEKATAFLANHSKPDPKPDPAAEKLVKQLGSPNFADRDTAEKKLKQLGPRAKAAVTAGTKDADPEIARRSEAVLNHIRREQAWPRFAKLLGDDADAKALFDAICSVPRNVELIEAAEVQPRIVAKLYADREKELHDQCHVAPNQRAWLPNRVSVGEVAGWMYLGTFSGTEKGGSNLNGVFLPDYRDMWRRSDNPYLFAASLDAGSLKVGARRLLAKWTENREAGSFAVEKALNGAIALNVSEMVPAAKKHATAVLKIQVDNRIIRGLCLAVIGKCGTKDDVPFLMQYANDRTIVHWVYVPNPDEDKSRSRVFRPGMDVGVEMRDIAVAAALLQSGLFWKQIGEYGFIRPHYPQGRVGDPELHGDVGFIRNEDREAAHKKAREFLDKQPKPAPKKIEPDPAAAKLVKQLGSPNFADRDTAEKKLKQLGPRAKAAVIAGTKDTDAEIARRSEAVLNHIRREQAWPRFAKLLGDDQHARDLFNVIWAVPRNVELIEKAEEHPESVTKLYTDREKEMNEQCRNPDKESWHPGKVSVGEVAGWMYLGTFPGAEKGGSRNVFLLDFPDMWLHPSKPYPFPAALGEGPYKVGARRILVKWTETRIGRPDFSKGLNGAIAYSIPEIVPVAKKYLTEVKQIDDNHRHCLVTIGKCGTKADLPFLARFADDRRVASSAFVNYPGDETNPPREFRPGKDQETQMRDLAMAMTLILNGATREQLDEFGFFVSRYWPRYSGAAGSPAPLPPVGKRPLAGDNPFTPSDIGFIHDPDREAAHKKAKAWLDKQPKPAPKKNGPDPDAEKLVKQLGSPNFTDRDAAEKKLKELGARAKTAVTAGTKDADPEIAQRSVAVLDHIQTAERAAFAKQFRDAKEDPLAISHPVWDRFSRITGDTKEARALFAAVIANDARFHRLAVAEANPADAARLYAAQFSTAVIVPAGPKGGLLPGKAERIPPDIDPADLAAGFLLGTLPGTSAKLPDRQEEDLDSRKGFVKAMTGPHAAPLRKLYPAWLATRTDADVLGSGLATARACNLTECLLLARKLAADPKVGVRTRADSLLVVGQFGGPEDVPLARPLLTETSRYGTFLVGDPSRAQVKDIAAAVMLMVHDQKPWEFGFKCTFPQTKADDRTGRNVTVWGFPSEEARASGHKAVLAYIKAAAKPVAKPEPTVVVGKPMDLKQFLADFRADEAGVKDFDHPLWKWFTAAAGKDKAARALFTELVADPDRADRLAKAAADPTSAGKLYAAEVGRVRKFSDDFNEAISVRWKEIADPAERTRAMMKAHEDAAANPPVGEVAAILFLGTLPSTADVSLGERPKRLGLDVSPVGLPMWANDKFAWGPAVRRLFASWLAARHLTEDQESGLAVASTVGIHETLPLARRWAADPLQPPKVRGMALAVVGHFGTAADRPLADALHDDGTSIGGSMTMVQTVAGARKESQRYWATVGDVALAVSVHLVGGDPFAFGCGPPGEKSLNLAWGSLGYLGFADEESREAAHKKAKAWLAQESRPR